MMVIIWCRCPVAVPGVRLADGAAALHTDRCHSLGSLYLPPAALPSLPGLDLHFCPCVGRAKIIVATSF